MKYTFRVKKPIDPESNYTKIPHIFWKLELDAWDKIMLGYLMTHQDMQPMTHTFISNALHRNRVYVRNSLKRLTTLGYIKIENRILTININNQVSQNDSDKNNQVSQNDSDKWANLAQISEPNWLTNNTKEQDENKQDENKQDDLGSEPKCLTSQATDVAVLDLGCDVKNDLLQLIKSEKETNKGILNFDLTKINLTGYTIQNVPYYASEFNKKQKDNKYIQELKNKNLLSVYSFLYYLCKYTSNENLKSSYLHYLNE